MLTVLIGSTPWTFYAVRRDDDGGGGGCEGGGGGGVEVVEVYLNSLLWRLVSE